MNILFDILRRDYERRFAGARQPLLPGLRPGYGPQVLWIGCSDHRVSPGQILGVEEADIFTHFNMGNQVVPDDASIHSAVEYAIQVLGIRRIIVCGHYGCGAVKVALRASSDRMDQVDQWVRPVRELTSKYGGEMNCIPDFCRRLDRLTEINVLEQVRRLRRLPCVLTTSGVTIHGWIYNAVDQVVTRLKN